MSELLDKVEPIAAGMRKEVLAHLETRLTPLLDETWPELEREISDLTGVLERSNAWRAEDEPGAIYLKVGCLLLAVYRALQPRFEERGELLDVLKSVIDEIAFRGGMEEFLRSRLGISPDAPAEAWDRLCANFLAWGREQYGSGWVQEQGIRDARRYFVNIRKCGFADFFLDNGAREVLYLLCATDYVWGDALEDYGIRFERPTTLSEGSDACRFQFFKTGG
jgi:hypothetical protein